ncbi:MAG: EAL domain-containing protein [Cyanothece sp. SIO1E1]|nr:EAL domain-containing protein [Cyanothece sp. SIO1E1]
MPVYLEVKADLPVSEECFRTTFERAAIGIVHIDANGRFLQVNRRFCRMVGYPRTELLTKGFLEITHPEDIEVDQQVFQQLMQGEVQMISQEKRYRCRDGSIVWGSVSASRVANSNGGLEYLIALIEDITDRKQAETALRENEEAYRLSQERLDSILGALEDVVWSVDAQTSKLLYLNSAVEKIYGYDMSAFFEHPDLWQSVVYPVDQPQVEIANQTFLELGKKDLEYRILRSDGEIRWLRERVRYIYDDDNQPIRIDGLITDITQNKQMELALSREKELAQVTLQSIGDGVITTDASGHVTHLNPSAEQLTGWSTAEAQGRSLSEVFKLVYEVSRKPAANPVNRVLQRGEMVNSGNHHVLIARNGTEHAIDKSAAPMRDRNGQVIGTVLVFHDVTESRRLSQQLSWQARHDTLTKLANRWHFEQQLVAAIDNAKIHLQEHTLCYLDLDQFKVVNDTCGHVAGDELLRQVATLLRAQVHESDTLARLGGDEFGVLLNHCSLEKAQPLADNLRKAIQDFRFVWEDKTFSMGVSIGLVTIDTESQSLNQLLSAADAACYAAKDRGRNRIHIYQIDDMELMRQRHERHWIMRIRQALEAGRLCLYQQAIVPTTQHLHSGLKHYEILLRMVDEQGKLIPPMAFIPAAERYDLMPTIDRWVIQTFFANCRNQNLENSPHSEASLYTINLSGASINDDQFLAFLIEQFALSAVPPQMICFEITETTAIANLNKAVDFMQNLKQLGCQFALDDFGSGMSSFGYLKQLPVDYLKIDGNFIRDVLDDPVDLTIVESIVKIGRVIGVKTIAEFVENQDIWMRLQNLGVDYVQGYEIAKPAPVSTPA